MRPIEIYAAAIVPALVLAISASAGQLVRFEAPVGGLDGATLEICTSAGCTPVGSLESSEIAQGARYSPAVVFVGSAPATPAGRPAWIEAERAGVRVQAENAGSLFWACAHDTNGDGIVGAPDVVALLRRWRTGTPVSAEELARSLASLGQTCRP